MILIASTKTDVRQRILNEIQMIKLIMCLDLAMYNKYNSSSNNNNNSNNNSIEKYLDSKNQSGRAELARSTAC